MTDVHQVSSARTTTWLKCTGSTVAHAWQDDETHTVCGKFHRNVTCTTPPDGARRCVLCQRVLDYRVGPKRLGSVTRGMVGRPDNIWAGSGSTRDEPVEDAPEQPQRPPPASQRRS